MMTGRRAQRRDVTALVLTIGESSTERALESVRRQTLQPAETLVVEGVTPFSAALRTGVDRIETPFFVQVDADMVLDDDCLERLRAAVTDEAGIVVGQLRDPLIGTIAGVKLFRRGCFDVAQLRDSIAPDVDFYWDIATQGWLTLYLLSYPPARGGAPHTFGDHLPALTPAYTYATYYLLGCRYFQRRDLTGFLWRLGRLRASPHAMAAVARCALCSGLFANQTRDVVKSSVRFNSNLLGCLAGASVHRAPLPVGSVDGARDLSQRFYEHGRTLAAREGCPELRAWLAAFGTQPLDATWIAEASLCRGFSSTRRSETASTVAARLEKMQRPLQAQRVKSP
jgi:hypothetical protein